MVNAFVLAILFWRGEGLGARDEGRVGMKPNLDPGSDPDLNPNLFLLTYGIRRSTYRTMQRASP